MTDISAIISIEEQWATASWLVYAAVCVGSALVLAALVPLGAALARRNVNRWFLVLLAALGIDAVISYQWALSEIFEHMDWGWEPVAVLLVAVVLSIAAAAYSYRRFDAQVDVPRTLSSVVVLPAFLIAVNGGLAFADVYLDRLIAVLAIVAGGVLIPLLLVVALIARRR